MAAPDVNAKALQKALDGGKCNFARVITGCWKQWHPGMKLQRCDIFNVGKNVYTVFPMPLGTNEYVSMTAPAHKHGAWKSPEGINFLFLQDDGESRTDFNFFDPDGKGTLTLRGNQAHRHVKVHAPGAIRISGDTPFEKK